MNGIVTNTRHHDISAGHRVAGHENKCRFLHGHNYRIHFTCQAAELDSLGRVVDFSVIKEKLCTWLEVYWDHKFLVWSQDPLWEKLKDIDGVVAVPFNPTAENMAIYLVKHIGPYVFASTGVELVKCTVDETRKCSATFTKDAAVIRVNIRSNATTP